MGSFPEKFNQRCLSQLISISVIIRVFKSDFAGRGNQLAEGGVQLLCALFHSFPFQGETFVSVLQMRLRAGFADF